MLTYCKTFPTHTEYANERISETGKYVRVCEDQIHVHYTIVKQLYNMHSNIDWYDPEETSDVVIDSRINLPLEEGSSLSVTATTTGREWNEVTVTGSKHGILGTLSQITGTKIKRINYPEYVDISAEKIDRTSFRAYLDLYDINEDITITTS